MSLVAATGVSRRYSIGGGEIRALDSVDLALTAGELVAVTGPSGSGKSTLLNLIGGLDRPTAGQLAVAGRDLRSLTPSGLAAYRRETVGFVFQAFRLLPHLSAAENVALPLLLAGAARSIAERRAADLLARVGLAARTRHRPSQLSAGEQQRVATARALVNEPRLLLADEPTGNLDSEASALLLDLFAELRAERGLTVLVATHDSELAARADRIVALRAGRLAEAAR